MVDSALCTLFNWDINREMDVLEDKSITLSENVDNNNGSPIDTKQSYFNYYLGSTCEDESLKSPSETSSSTKSPKSEITLNALQHEQNTLIEQRIQDRTNNLRTMHLNNTMTPLWTNYNNFANRMFPNVEINSVQGGAGVLPTQISSCMFGVNRNTQWFNRGNYSTDPWSADYSQDPTMRSRPCFSSHQTRELEREFTICQYVTRRRRIELAYSLNLTEKQIKTWFQNRRVKERKQKKMSGDINEHEQHTSI